jgi:TP901 family phage tail tape measure protein
VADRDMKVSVLVQLVDRLTAPLRAITRGIGAMANSVGDLGRRIGLIGGALAALSFAGPIQAAAKWDEALRESAITLGKTGAGVEEFMARTGALWKQIGQDTGQYAAEVQKGAKLLGASGMDQTLIEKLMPTIAKVATATGATIEDTAKTVFSLSDSLKVSSDDMAAILGKLTVAGKLGRFEFRDMARELPELTAQMGKFGIKGAEAVEFLGASLQIGMLGTASPSMAATNLTNFLTKINAPEAIKKFEKELNVDVTGVMTDAAAKGINPIEAVLQKMTEKLKPQQAEIDKIMKKAGVSDKEREEQIKTLLSGTKVGKLYADMQVLGFILPFMQNVEKFKEFRQQIREAGINVINEDFASAMRGLAPQMKQLSDLGTTAMERIGLAFARNIPAIKDGFQQMLGWVAAIDRSWPGLIDTTLSWTGTLLLLGAGIAVLTPVVGALAGVLGLLLSPIGLVVLGLTALAAGAVYAWANWSTVGPQLSALWDSIATGFSAAWESIRSGQALDAAISWLKAKVPELGAAFVAALPGIVSAIGDGIATGLVAIVKLGVTIIAELAKALLNNVDALTKAGAELIGYLTEAIAGKIKGLFDFSGMEFKWPSLSLPDWFGKDKPGSVGGVKSAPTPTYDPMGNPTGFNPTSAPGAGIGGSAGFTRTAGGPAANGNAQVGGVIRVEAVEGSRVVNVESANPAVPLVPNRGTMLGRA